MIVFVDPGAKPGYCVSLEPFQIVSLSRVPPRLAVPHIVVCERPRLRPAGRRERPRRIDPNTVVTLALTAGQQVGYLSANEYCTGVHWLEVADWKNAVYRDGMQLKKETFCARVRRDLRLGEQYTDDEIDSAGLAWAWGKGAR